MGFGAWGLGFGVMWFRVWGWGLGLCGLGLCGFGFGAWGLTQLSERYGHLRGTDYRTGLMAKVHQREPE